jgi:hypothetical protein
VRQHPEVTLQERARHFVVRIYAIWYALFQGHVTRKKTLRLQENATSFFLSAFPTPQAQKPMGENAAP